jgi:hypothetical protein
MPIQATEPGAGVDLVPVRKAAPAPGALPQPGRMHRSIFGDRGNAIHDMPPTRASATGRLRTTMPRQRAGSLGCWCDHGCRNAHMPSSAL